MKYLLGIIFPCLILYDAIACFTGERTGVKAVKMSRENVIALGFMELAMALCIHAHFSECYDDRPLVKYAFFITGGTLLVFGFVYRVLTGHVY
jgi:hypothetical protein